jgi:hypothetical protein
LRAKLVILPNLSHFASLQAPGEYSQLAKPRVAEDGLTAEGTLPPNGDALWRRTSGQGRRR